MAESRLALCEPAVVMDTFVSGVGDVEQIAPNLFRVTFYAKQRDTYTGEPSFVVVAKFIVTFETMLAMSAATVEKRDVLPDHLAIPQTQLN